MTKEQFIEKWGDRIQTFASITDHDPDLEKQDFISDLNSLFNLRTETRTPEEVRERLDKELKGKQVLLDMGETELAMFTGGQIEVLKWFLKE